jgi:mono/diheme cytochrome c family protein
VTIGTNIRDPLTSHCCDTAVVDVKRVCRGHRVVASLATLTLVVAAAACGGGSNDSGSAGGGGAVSSGEQLSRSAGCAGCHGANFEGGAGPEWIGLAGSVVQLTDGSTVVADTAYLTRAIADPAAELVADYNLRMPANNLSGAEIADIVAFIETLADG